MNTGRMPGNDMLTEDSPQYGISFETLKAALVATVLLIGNIALMYMFAFTALADLMIWLYTDAFFAPFSGLVVFGILLAVGRWIAISGLTNNSYGLAVIGVLISEFTYGVFGAGVLSYAPSDIYLLVLGVTAVITGVITLAVCFYVYSTSKDLSGWREISGGLFLIGIILYLVYTFISNPVLGTIAVVVILLGFVADLIFEVWMTSQRNRSPMINGFAVYIAAAGVFVHVLQFVIQYALSES